MTTKPVTDAEIDAALEGMHFTASGLPRREDVRRALEQFSQSRVVEAVVSTRPHAVKQGGQVMTTPTPHGAPELTNIDLAKAHGADICDEWDIVDKTEREQISFTTDQLDAYTSAAIEQAQSKHEGKSMNNEQAKAAALSWHGEAGGELLPQLTANELAGIVNEAIQQAAGAVPEGCTPADAQMLRVANHQLAEKNEALRSLLRPFAELARPELSRATIAYMVKQDPERQHFQTPTMHRAFNRAAEALWADYSASPSPLGREAGKEGSSDHLVPCAGGGVTQPLTDAPRWQVGTWTLTAPDGRTWQADSPLKACSAEQRERIPPEVALKRIFDALDDGGTLT